VPTGREETALRAIGKVLITAIALMAGLLSGCRAARPSKYYQLTVQADPGAVEKADAVTVTLLL
jgi:hypothetical protein